MKKKCQYSKCGEEFTPNKPRQQYCSDIHRVYANREKGVAQKAQKVPPTINPDKIQAVIKKTRVALAEKELIPKERLKEKVILPGGIIALSNEEIRKQIAGIKAEQIPELRNTALGRKSWANGSAKKDH